MPADVLETIRAKARAAMTNSGRKPRIVLGDATDVRMLDAARRASELQLAEIVLVGDAQELERIARESNISITAIEVVSSFSFPTLSSVSEEYYARRSSKISSIEDAEKEILGSDLLFGALLVRSGYADGMIAGSESTTADVIRAALKGIGLAEGVSVLSSMFLMAFSPIAGIREAEFSLAFADCGVVVEPTSEQLADIAIETAKTYRALSGNEPRVAMLSYSTHGSASSDSTIKMIEAAARVKEKAPSLSIDGELQFDAAFVPVVAARKAPTSIVAGHANVFIFPNLDAGNIAYKIAERLGHAEAIGPILQGLQKPMNDLSRGASVSDIVNMIAVTVLQA